MSITVAAAVAARQPVVAPQARVGRAVAEAVAYIQAEKFRLLQECLALAVAVVAAVDAAV